MTNPINKDFKIKLIDKIPSTKIIHRYKNECEVDVSRYFDRIEFVEIYECKETGYSFYFPFSIIGDSDFYINLSKGNRNYYHDRWEHKVAIKYAKSGEKWLEVGSGNSYFLGKLEKVGVSALGLELNSDEVLRVENEKFKVHNCDFFSFDSKNEGFDVVAAFQVLEHIKDVSAFFIKANELLKKNGRLIIAVPNNNPYLYVFDKYHTLNLPPHHMGLWTGQSLERVGSNFGFSVKNLQYEPISQYELNYILNLCSLDDFSVNNLKFIFLKGVRKVFPKKIFQLVSSIYRKFIVNGRNIFIVFEKND